MGEIIYNKLVRDRIPEILKEKNLTLSARILDDEEYYKSLNNKLEEELAEYLQSNSIEELADIEEVLRAILDYKNITFEEFEKIRLEKQSKRGAFKSKIFLETVNED